MRDIWFAPVLDTVHRKSEVPVARTSKLLQKGTSVVLVDCVKTLEALAYPTMFA